MRSVYLRCITTAAVLATTLLLSACGNVYSRDDFTTAVVGKSSDEIMQTYGKPDSVQETSPAQTTWTYNHKTFDLSHENKMDSHTKVVFDHKTGATKLYATKVEFD